MMWPHSMRPSNIAIATSLRIALPTADIGSIACELSGAGLGPQYMPPRGEFDADESRSDRQGLLAQLITYNRRVLWEQMWGVIYRARIFCYISMHNRKLMAVVAVLCKPFSTGSRTVIEAGGLPAMSCGQSAVPGTDQARSPDRTATFFDPVWFGIRLPRMSRTAARTPSISPASAAARPCSTIASCRSLSSAA